MYSIGASGPQPGITFGPSNRISAPPPPIPSQNYYPSKPSRPGSFSYSPQSSHAPSMFASSPTTMSPTSGPYPNEKRQEMFDPNNNPPSNPNQPHYQQSSLQPSFSIRNPPHLNPRHSQSDANGNATADVDLYNEPPPPYEPRNENTPNDTNSISPTNTNNITPIPATASHQSQQPNNFGHSQTNEKMASQSFDTVQQPSVSQQQQPSSPVSSINSHPIQVPPSPGIASHHSNSPSLIHFSSPAVSNVQPTAPITTTSALSPLAAPSQVNVNSTTLNNINTTNTITVVAKYDFLGQQPGDLSFKAGDRITVTNWTNDKESWWVGSIGHHSGTFPANYTDIAP